MKIKSLSLLLCISLLFGCQPKHSSESRLKQRVYLYYGFMIKGDIGSTWDLLWHGARRRRSWNDWMLFCKESELDRKLLEFHVESISISKVDKQSYYAKVKVTGKYKLLKVNKIESVEGEDEWVFENGDWFKYID